jgi:hypothetical protein
VRARAGRVVGAQGRGAGAGGVNARCWARRWRESLCGRGTGARVEEEGGCMPGRAAAI